ncbi:Acid protease [Mycena venus]|uniref:Acid protease n=1 Tax=Mycena venus TaxID=2733690 RepID=A0A8H7D7R7_9AGAR|nr:Acid protease [Mycena venus]
MFYSVFSGLFVSSVLTVVDVCANPLPPPPTGFSVPINRSFHQRPPVNSSSLPVCNVQPIKHECKGLQLKYRDVDKNFNNGIQFGPIFDTGNMYETAEAFIPPVLAQTHATTSLKDFMAENLDMMYYGSVKVGTPPQELTVDIDTGSADLWFPWNCPDCTNKQFEDFKSSTCKNSDESFSICYGSGEVYGTLMQETVSIGGLEVQDQWFGGVSEVSGDFNNLPNDGLVGLAFGSIAQCGKPTIFENLIANGKVSPSIFSVHLARHGGRDDSSLCFGCIDYRFMLKPLDPIVWVPVLTKAYWSVPMDGMVVDEKRELQVPTPVRAMIDTGTTLIYLPQAVASAFYAMVRSISILSIAVPPTCRHQIPGSKRALQFGPEFYTYPCSTALNIEFVFAGHRFPINIADFNLGMTEPNSPDCVGGILSLSPDDFPSDLAIIGDEFLKSWYSIFDYSGGPDGCARVGFSPSINNGR